MLTPLVLLSFLFLLVFLPRRGRFLGDCSNLLKFVLAAAVLLLEQLPQLLVGGSVPVVVSFLAAPPLLAALQSRVQFPRKIVAVRIVGQVLLPRRQQNRLGLLRRGLGFLRRGSGRGVFLGVGIVTE